MNNNQMYTNCISEAQAEQRKSMKLLRQKIVGVHQLVEEKLSLQQVGAEVEKFVVENVNVQQFNAIIYRFILRKLKF